MSTLAEQYPVEQARVRELVSRYREIQKLPGVNRSFAIGALEAILARAEEALASGDIVAMLRSFAELQGCE